MKKRSGFTLVELIAVIIIVAIISLMGTAIYNAVANSVKARQYESIKDLIEAKAYDYYQNTGISEVYVDTLISEGYLEADDANGIIYNPTDTSDQLNCHVVTITSSDNVSVSDNSNGSDGVCNEDAIVDSLFTIDMSGVDLSNTYNGWIKATNNISFVVKYLKDGSTLQDKEGNVITLDSFTFNWSNDSAPGEVTKGKTYTVSANEFDRVTVYVTFVYNDKTINLSKEFKIDGNKPVINSVNIDKANEWTKDKYVTVEASDYDSFGSGLNSYCLSTSNGSCNGEWINNSNTSFNIYNFNVNNKTYYLFVKDNVGLVSDPYSFTISYIDSIAPTCTNSGDSTTWTNGNRTIYYGCIDNESGCDASNSGGSVTVDYTATTININSYVIKDKVGNETTCEARTANAYVDKSAPTCTNSGDSTTWTNGNRVISYGCSDGESGCDSSYSGGSQIFDSTTKQATINAYVIKDKVGNETTCNARTANVYVDKIAPTCTNSGDNSSWTGGNVTIKYGCSDSDSGCDSSASGGSTTVNWSSYNTTIGAYTIKDNAGNSTYCASRTANTYVDKCDNTSVSYGSYSSCSVSCGGGTQSRSVTYTSNLSGWTCNSTTETQSCNTQACCSSTKASYGSWGTCSSSCGGGTQYRSVDYYSNYDGSYCGSASESQSCNTQSCCSSTYASYGSWGGCSASCGGGTQYRSVAYYSNYNGQLCSSTSQSQSCNTQTCCSGYLINGTCYSTRTSLQYYCYYGYLASYTDSVYEYCNCYTYASCGYCSGWSVFGDGTGWCCSDWWNGQSGNCCAHVTYYTAYDYRYETGGCTGGYSEYSSSYRTCASGYTQSGNYCYK